MIRLAQSELLASDLNGYANLREHWMYGLRAVCAVLDQSGVPKELLAKIVQTVEPVPDLWIYAVPSAPAAHIQNEMATLFPEWMTAFESSEPIMDSGPTAVGTTDSLDASAADTLQLIQLLAQAGLNGALELPLVGEVFGIPVQTTIEQAMRMAAMYDLYMDLRCAGRKATTAAPAQRRKISIDPAFLLLGLNTLQVASYAAGEVLRKRAGKREKKRKSVSELAALIRQKEGE